MPRTRTRNPNFVVAREAIVINVGARPVEYGKITVSDRKTGEPKTIDNHNHVVDGGDEGIPYAFKENQKVSRNHPAVKECPGAFASLDELDLDEDDLVEG